MAQTIQEIAHRLVDYCRNDQYDQCYEQLFSTDCKSIEPDDSHWSIADGMTAVRNKRLQWSNSLAQFHEKEISDPICADGYFTCTMKYDVTFKTGDRRKVNQVCVYKVDNSKITEERFFYPT